MGVAEIKRESVTAEGHAGLLPDLRYIVAPSVVHSSFCLPAFLLTFLLASLPLVLLQAC